MEKIITKDGSIAFYSEKYEEYYKSKTGAVEESFKKFIEPTNLHILAKNDHVIIMDVCFGPGYNTLAAISTIRKINPKCKIKIYALENDQNIIEKTKTFDMDKELQQDHNILKALVDKGKVGNVELIILLGDAREEIKKIKESVDIVFLDPFSPKKCPELWEADFFIEIFSKMKIGAYLTTYSCARIVRDNLRKAGFLVKNGPCVGRRAPSTIAIKEE